ncbi:MAG: hypothetical protein RL398_2806 [Planctomycetota bacterium]
MNGAATPAATIARWAEAVVPGTTVLDLAAGGGRHTQLLLARGCRVTAVDRDTTELRRIANARLEVVDADLEGSPWPLGDRTFGIVLVTNYLWRPLFWALRGAVAPGGELWYETFAVGHERFGRPSNPDFLLREGELPDVFGGDFAVLEYHHGEHGAPATAIRQRLRAQRRLG